MEIKIAQVISAIKAATQELDNTMHLIGTDIGRHRIKVHVANLRDLEQVPGRAKVTDDGEEYDTPMRHTKKYAGAEFFCLTERSQA